MVTSCPARGPWPVNVKSQAIPRSVGRNCSATESPNASSVCWRDEASADSSAILGSQAATAPVTSLRTVTRTGPCSHSCNCRRTGTAAVEAFSQRPAATMAKKKHTWIMGQATNRRIMTIPPLWIAVPIDCRASRRAETRFFTPGFSQSDVCKTRLPVTAKVVLVSGQRDAGNRQLVFARCNPRVCFLYDVTAPYLCLSHCGQLARETGGAQIDDDVSGPIRCSVVHHKDSGLVSARFAEQKLDRIAPGQDIQGPRFMPQTLSTTSLTKVILSNGILERVFLGGAKQHAQGGGGGEDDVTLAVTVEKQDRDALAVRGNRRGALRDDFVDPRIRLLIELARPRCNWVFLAGEIKERGFCYFNRVPRSLSCPNRRVLPAGAPAFPRPERPCCYAVGRQKAAGRPRP